MKIAIIGAGPIGLAAAAHLVEKEIPFTVFEMGSSIGNNIASWSHVKLFSPWQYNLDKAAVRLLAQTDWKSPDLEALHTGKDFLESYLNPLAELSSIKPNIQLNAKVVAITRRGIDKMKTAQRDNTQFELRVEINGHTEIVHADGIIDAAGTWNQPNPIGSGGIPAIGESEHAQFITRGIPDIGSIGAAQYSGKSLMVIGSGHSAINTLLDLADLQYSHPKTKLHWILRKKNLAKVYGGQENDGFAARGALGIRLQGLVESGRLTIHTPFYVQRVDKADDKINIEGLKDGKTTTIKGIDRIISNTGSRPNLDMLRELRVDLDSSLDSVFDLAPLIDPNIHSCGTVRPHGEKELRHPEKNFYIVGSKSYGRAPTFLLATGYEQVRSIVAYLVGDLEGALRTELELPETGVCSTDFEDEVCCAPAFVTTEKESKESACC